MYVCWPLAKLFLLIQREVSHWVIVQNDNHFIVHVADYFEIHMLQALISNKLRLTLRRAKVTRRKQDGEHAPINAIARKNIVRKMTKIDTDMTTPAEVCFSTMFRLGSSGHHKVKWGPCAYVIVYGNLPPSQSFCGYCWVASQNGFH